jgi:DNA polymerase elongation subunit (family B)
MTVELVSGWVDDDRVYVVERSGDDTRIRSIRARWSMFFNALDQEDRQTLQRMPEVVGLEQVDGYTRIDFKNRWTRKDVRFRIESNNRGSLAGRGPAFELLEADVNPLRRMLSDNPNLVVSANPRLGWFDIETDSRKRFSDAREGRARVLSWALVDHRGQSFSAVLEADTDAAEKALIENFLSTARDVDVLLAWNGDGFDFPVLAKRGDKLGVMPQGRYPMWNRWCWLDHLAVYAKYNMHSHESGAEKASFKLQDVAMNVLGQGKDDFDASKTWEAWAAGGAERQRMHAYNIQDTALLPRIEARTGYVALHLAVCAITRCFPDSNSLMASQQGDGFLLSLGAQHGYRWPTKADRPALERYEGAYVMEPTRLGAIDDVHVADFASLYPSIMRSWNMSPDTLLYPADRDPPQGSSKLPFDHATARFRNDRRGMLPLALDELVTKRGEYNAAMKAAPTGSPQWDHYKRLISAFKIVANSFYGIVGSAYTRFFSRPVAEGVTKTGAWLIKRVALEAKTAGLDPFYGDTDSIFVAGDRARFGALVEELNARWEPMLSGFGCQRCFIDLDFEKSFRRLILVSAKRYAAAYSVFKGDAVGPDMKPEVKGLEYKRGDTVRLAREMQREAIGMLLGDEIPPADEMMEFLVQWRERVLRGELVLDDIVLSQGVKDLGEYKARYTSKVCTGRIGKQRCGNEFLSTEVVGATPEICKRCRSVRKLASPPLHVRVALLLKERGDEVREGTRIEYVVVAGNGERLEGIPARDPGALERVDREHYWDAKICPPTARILECVYPGRPWQETPSQRRRREAAEMRPRYGADNGPLFAAVD